MQTVNDRLRIVYVCPETPWPVIGGGRFRIEALLRALSALAEVRLIVVGERPDGEARRFIREAGGAIYPARRESPAGRLCRILRAVAHGRSIPAERYLSPRRVEKLRARFAAEKPDLIVLGDVYLAAAFLEAARPYARAIVVDTHDAASLVARRISAASHRLPEKLAYRLLAANTFAMEARWLRRADQLWTLSEDDAAYYRGRHRLPNVAVVPIPVALTPATTPQEEPHAAVFAGSFSYWPNEDAALRLIAMAKGLRQRGALGTLYLVGVAPTERMRAAAAGAEGLIITGRVPDVGTFLDRAALVVVPLAAGSGVKVKILEAMARGRPILTTPVGAEGIAIQPGLHAEVAPLEGFEDAFVALMADPARRTALGAAGRRLVEERYSPAAVENRVRALVAKALAAHQGRE